LKAAKWVQANPQAAATLAVEKKYLASTSEINGLAISRLRYSPSISGGEAAVKTAAIAMQQAKMLRASTNLDELAQRAFARLDGVSDDWIKAVQVEKVAGGQLLTNVPVTSLNDASAIGVTAKSCCEVAKNE